MWFLTLCNRLQKAAWRYLSRHHDTVWTVCQRSRKLLRQKKRRVHVQVRHCIIFCTFSSPTACDLRLGKPASMRRWHLFKLQAASVCKLTAIPPTLCCRILQREAVTSCQNRGSVWSGVSAKFAHCGLALITIGSCSFTAILQVFLCFYLLACACGGG